MDSASSTAGAPQARPARPLEVETIRFRGEPAFADALLASGVLGDGTGMRPERPTADRVRRQLLATHLKLSENLAPEVFQYARETAAALGLAQPVEIYQAQGEENAAHWRCAEVVFVSVQGRMTSLLDRASFIALLGHEFGHHLAHTGGYAGQRRQEAVVCAGSIACDGQAPLEARVAASRLAMAMELTADRFAALAVGARDGPVRLLMCMVTGLPAERLKADVEAYLAQARALFEEEAPADTAPLGSHPEHLLRAYALALFVESDVFQALTGHGSGSRKLAGIDAALERLLVGAGGRLLESEKDQTVAPEIQEFGLCAAALMAAADGELDAGEAKSLEDTFSTVIPGWKELLEPDRALARFSELLPVAIAGGESVATSVFHLLVHVMLVDREMHVRELEVLKGVGRSLRQEALFERLFEAVTRAVRVATSAKPVERPLPALPPGRLEAQAALAGLFAGMSRRGGGTVSLARLLRITGRAAWDPAVLAAIETACAQHPLVLVAPPVQGVDGTVRLDQALVFRLTEAEVARRQAADLAARTRGVAAAKTRDALLDALKHLRERLISGDGRSPSVRLYRAAPGHHFDLSQLDQVVAGRSERIVALLQEAKTIPLLAGDEAGLHKTATGLARDLRQLEREFRAKVEETGCQDLFVGYPFLMGMVDGFFVRAPLMLHPFSLASDGKGAGAYALKRRGDDDATANQALLRLIFAKKGYTFTDELAESLDTKAAEGGEALLEALRQIGLDTRPLTGALTPLADLDPAAAALLPDGIAVAENAAVGFFPQSSSDLLHDYDELLERLDPQSTANLQQTLNAACDVLPAAYRPAFEAPAGADTPQQPIVYSDPSQRAAVLRSRTARLMVMDGPPGTGKSQTIVNLVADALAKGGRVAVVCEKRVALDVVKQRMDSAGIGHLATVVHDVQDDRKALYTHIADRLEHPERRTFNDATLVRCRAEARDLEQQLELRQGWLATPTEGGLTLGQAHAMAAAFATRAVAAPGLGAVPREELPRLARGAKDLQPSARLWKADSIFRAGAGLPARQSLARASAADWETISRALRAAWQARVVYERGFKALPIPPDSLEAVAPALELVASLKGQAVAPVVELFGPMAELRVRDPGATGELEECFARLEQHRAAAEAEGGRVPMDDSPELTAALSVACHQVASWFRFLRPSWWKACGTIRAALVRQWPEKAGAPMEPGLLAMVERRVQAARAWAAADRLFGHFQMQSQVPRQSNALYVQVGELLEAWTAAGKLAPFNRALAGAGLWPADEAGRPIAGGWTGWIATCQAALELLAAQRQYVTAAQAAAPFPYAANFEAAQWSRLAETFVAEAGALGTADRILLELQTFLPEAARLAEALADALPDGPPSAWAEAVLRGWAEANIALAEQREPSVKGLDQAPPLGSLEQASARLLELHQAIAREEALRLATEADQFGLMAVAPAEPRARRAPAQAVRENLIRECRKQRNVMPMRTLVRRFAKEGLLDVAPVWLMSPETTAVLFPREPVFDLLIIDEASQCTVENGLPVLTRANRAVVAGDDKQMPPSAFFKSAIGLEAEVADPLGDETPPDAFDAESLLVLARNVAPGAPLRWHYRALFEELIAFSNHAMYGGSLLTIPATLSRSAPPALRWVRIEEGTWDAGTNLPEARRVVGVLAEVLARPARPSVGVVTFNIQQRRAVLDEIDARRAADPAFARVFDAAMGAESLDARPFVKNLESVQGDEREVIIFSLGYAPARRKKRDGSEEAYVPARFGPVGQKGGERRLNVAVSRARTEIIVVSSFDPALLSVAHTKHDGPRLFKAFVEFARHLGEGRRNQAERILALVNDANQRRPGAAAGAPTGSELFLPLHHQIALELERAGLAVETLVGASEFRLPIAIVHAGDKHHYTLAVLCEDGATANGVFEDYVHIPNVLAHRQWRHLRVNAREWHRDRARVIARIRTAVGLAN